MNFVYGDRVVIIKGRLKGEKGKVIGESNLNMEHVIIVSRENKKARNPVMGFAPDRLAKGEMIWQTNQWY